MKISLVGIFPVIHKYFFLEITLFWNFLYNILILKYLSMNRFPVSGVVSVNNIQYDILYSSNICVFDFIFYLKILVRMDFVYVP